MADLTIWCLVNGTSSGNAFSVKVPSNGTVDDLKDLIKAKQAPGFDDIAASSLTLWKVEIPTTPVRQITLSLPNEESILSCLNLNEDQQATITQCRNNNEPIHLSRLNLSLDQKAVITRCQLSDVDVAIVKFLGDPSVDISDDEAFGTKPLPRRNIHVIVQPPPSDDERQSNPGSLSDGSRPGE
ncbi:hypothetical protein B0O80DRAFT_23817 [Mortierella sp. GBAus27b]|nr:hypothetical protein B0O80DRAFT_23817 [Mortierella sp. GBAus27b]